MPTPDTDRGHGYCVCGAPIDGVPADWDRRQFRSLALTDRMEYTQQFPITHRDGCPAATVLDDGHIAGWRARSNDEGDQ